ncbi:SRPBCC family protein [Nocardioides sp. InS609-2]|uniref:SRPBCC family protein n=1 Tax=Nocardioides sp. InS609-2 TaxID=2760705 RepID=UPI0024A61B9C|nr:SRPBCC family protein [Nocardioides sp. InS609-2]
MVDVPHPPEVVFRYLADPRNRPEWQSSLLSVQLEDGDAEPRLGLSWSETTVIGMRAHLEITELVPYRVLGESARMGGIDGTLVLRFKARTGGCRIEVEGVMSAGGLMRYAAAAAARVASRVAISDLKRAGRVLSTRGQGG